MGFKEKAKQYETDRDRAVQDLENRYPQWQHAVFVLNQIVEGYISSDPELRARLIVEERKRHITDPILKREKQLDKLVITLRRPPKQVVSFEALPLSPPILGAAGRIELKNSGAPGSKTYYILWDGKGESPNNWKIRSTDTHFDKRLNAESLNEVLGELFVLE